MRFCPKCNSVLMPRNNKLHCHCGYSEELSEEEIDKEYRFKSYEKKKNEVIIVRPEDQDVLPTKKITCYRCGGTKGYWWTVQTRSADEAPTYFIRCAKCGNTWRMSN